MMFVRSLIPAFFLLVACLAANPVQAAKPKFKVPKPELVKDIMTVVTTEGSYPDSFYQVGNMLYFSAETKTHGRELWKSDGTPKGTVLVKDLIAGFSSSNPAQFVDFDGLLYFTTSDSSLWRTNGTDAGTILIHKWKTDYERISQPIVIGRNIYFATTNFENGERITFWQSNGTPEGTLSVSEMDGRLTSQMGNLDSSIYFHIQDIDQTNQLWKWSPANEDIVKIKSFIDSSSYHPARFVTRNALIWFIVDAAANPELWRSDGTEQGTYKISDIFESENPPSYLKNSESVYFSRYSSGNGEIWKSDGSLEGTVLVKRLTNNEAGIGKISATENAIFFTALSAGRLQLWSTDGTEVKTEEIQTLPQHLQYVLGMITIDNQIYLSLNTDEGAGELWKVIRSSSVTYTASRIQGPTEADYLSLAVLPNGSIVFSAKDSSRGYELWKMKNSASGATLLKDIRGGTDSSNPGELRDLNGGLVFKASSINTGEELWRTNGKKSTTSLLKDVYKGRLNSAISRMTILGDEAFFSANDGSVNNNGENGIQLWKTNGSPKGTKLLESYAPDQAGVLNSLTNVNGQLYFTGSRIFSYTQKLYKYGNPTQTLATDVTYIYPTSLASKTPNIYYINDQAELWKSDGTISGTTKIKELGSGYEYVDFSGLVTSWNLIYFVLNGDETASEIWRSDGTPEGTWILKSLEYGADESVYITDLTQVADSLFFSIHTAESGVELWRTDGSVEGTALIKSIGFSRPGDFLNYPRPIASDGSTLYLRGRDADEYSLWKTDGTTEGTIKISNIDPGSTGVFYLGKFYFSANDGIHGDELWSSDGTETGTRMVYDLTGDSGSGGAGYLQVAGGKLYFTGTTEQTGTELYVFDASGL